MSTEEEPKAKRPRTEETTEELLSSTSEGEAPGVSGNYVVVTVTEDITFKSKRRVSTEEEPKAKRPRTAEGLLSSTPEGETLRVST